MQVLLVSPPVSIHIWDQRSLRKLLILHLAAKAENAKGQRELQVGKELASFAEFALHEASSHQHGRDKGTLGLFLLPLPLWLWAGHLVA